MAFGQLHRGTVVEWDDERGYGFVRDAGGSRLFFHVTDVQHGDPRPMLGDQIVFGIAPGRDGRPSAKPVRIASTDLRRRPQRLDSNTAGKLGSGLRLVAAAALAGVAFIGSADGQLPNWLPLAYLAMGGVSFIAYWRDKAAALDGRWRIPESTLHALDILGGVVGGLIAQVTLRHKTRKHAYAVVTAGIVGLHALAMAVMLIG